MNTTTIPRATWRFAWLYAAPHRMAFAAGALMLALSALWWAAAMLGLSSGHALHFGLPLYQAHGLVMALGFMPLFFAGFLFTAGPKWLGHGPVDAAELAPPLLAQVAGWAVFLLGTHGRDAAFGAVFGAMGLAAVAAGWTQLWLRFVAMLRTSIVPDRAHAKVIAVAGGFGTLALWAAAAGVALSEVALVRAAIHGALWLFIGMVYASVAHRMIPFFSAAAVPVLDAWRPMWLLWAFITAFALEGALAVFDTLFGPLPFALQALQGALEVPAGVALLALALRWGLVQSLRVRLLAMLHLGFVWLGLAFVLAGVSHLMSAMSEGASTLGVAPLHAYTMGFLGSTLIAMATRVSAGHGGRTLAADDLVWVVFWVLQAAVVARVVAGVLSASGVAGAMPLIAAAAVTWGVVCAAWALRYGRWYGTPRADGRPG